MKTKLPNSGLYDWVTGKDCKTLKVVDVSESVEVPKGKEGLTLLYTKDRNGEIVQLRNGCSRVHYHTASIAMEEHRDSALIHTANWLGTTKKKLIELCLKHSPSLPEIDHKTA